VSEPKSFHGEKGLHLKDFGERGERFYSEKEKVRGEGGEIFQERRGSFIISFRHWSKFIIMK